MDELYWYALFLFGVVIGALLSTVAYIASSDILGRGFRWIVKKCKKFFRRTEGDLSDLCDDAQILLGQFMEKIDYYGREVYAVTDVKMFDALVRNHKFKKFDYYGGCDLDYCINENLKSGAGFLIILNGEQYVAIPSPKPVGTDCFID